MSRSQTQLDPQQQVPATFAATTISASSSPTNNRTVLPMSTQSSKITSPDSKRLLSQVQSSGPLCVCGNAGEFECSGCGQQAYCSSVCQRKDWQKHFRVCKSQKHRKPSIASGDASAAATEQIVSAPRGDDGSNDFANTIAALNQLAEQQKKAESNDSIHGPKVGQRKDLTHTDSGEDLVAAGTFLVIVPFYYPFMYT
jgi:hypothetical protein